MFESAALSRKLSKAEFEPLEVELRTALLLEQLDISEKRDRAILLLIAGIDGAGKALVAQRLLDWLDPRLITTNAFYLPSEGEQRYPRLQRYWHTLPAKGRMSIVFGSWYHQPLYERITGTIDHGTFQEEMHRIAAFETMLANEGYIISKLWLHLPRKERKKLTKSSDRSATAKVRMREWGDLAKLDYDLARGAVEEMDRITSTAEAPWSVVPGANANYRDALAGQILLDRLKEARQAPAPVAPQPIPKLRGRSIETPTIVDRLDLSEPKDPKSYNKKLRELQNRLHRLTQEETFSQTGIVAVFEGPDAAGKGGCIRRSVRALDPRLYQVHSIAGPSDEELAHPYLWRFWRRMPSLGQFAVFDRSWYGRVLVERVEGLCEKQQWERAYQEIVDFESQLTEGGLKVVKFWLQISEDEQLRRFKQRETTPFKRFKITQEDWRNRKKWDAYQTAAVEMIDRTSTINAPWILVPAESKKIARIRVLKEFCALLEQRNRSS